MGLIVAIFLLVLVTELITWIGKPVLLNLAYAAYIRIFHGPAVARHRALKTEVLKTKQELLQTSAQDHFAKWAKLRRSVDKGLAELDKMNSDIATTRTKFSLQFNTALWVLTTGVQFIIGWWYRKSAVFYLPTGWLGPLTWWLSFPFAPAGSVSCGVWQMACRRVIKVGERVVKDVLELREPTLAEPELNTSVRPSRDEKVAEKPKA